MTTRAAPDRKYEMVEQLINLESTRNTNSSSRAALARLRRAAQDCVAAAPYVAPYLPANVTARDEELYYMVAALFAWSRLHKGGVSLGAAFAQIKDDSGSMEARFFTLLSAPFEALPNRLGHAVRLLASKDVAIDWNMLMYDVLNWDDPRKRCQRALARDYYRKPGVTAEEPASTGIEGGEATQ